MYVSRDPNYDPLDGDNKGGKAQLTGSELTETQTSSGVWRAISPSGPIRAEISPDAGAGPLGPVLA